MSDPLTVQLGASYYGTIRKKTAVSVNDKNVISSQAHLNAVSTTTTTTNETPARNVSLQTNPSAPAETTDTVSEKNN